MGLGQYEVRERADWHRRITLASLTQTVPGDRKAPARPAYEHSILAA